MKRGGIEVELDWDDRVGFIRRTLPVSRFCTQCGGASFKRLDTHKRCRHPDFVPVQCLSCVPSDATWRALPRRKGSDEPSSPRRSLRARVSGFVTSLVGRRRA